MSSPEPEPTVVDPTVLAARRALRVAPAEDDRLAALQTALAAAQVELVEQRREGAREVLRLRGALAAAEERATVLGREVEDLTRDLVAAARRPPAEAAAAAEVARLRAELEDASAERAALAADLEAERARVTAAAGRAIAALRELGEADPSHAPAPDEPPPTAARRPEGLAPPAPEPHAGLADALDRAALRLRAGAADPALDPSPRRGAAFLRAAGRITASGVPLAVLVAVAELTR